MDQPLSLRCRLTGRDHMHTVAAWMAHEALIVPVDPASQDGAPRTRGRVQHPRVHHGRACERVHARRRASGIGHLRLRDGLGQPPAHAHRARGRVPLTDPLLDLDGRRVDHVPQGQAQRGLPGERSRIHERHRCNVGGLRGQRVRAVACTHRCGLDLSDSHSVRQVRHRLRPRLRDPLRVNAAPGSACGQRCTRLESLHPPIVLHGWARDHATSLTTFSKSISSS